MEIKCIQNKEIKTTGGKQTREFNYIDNIIDGILFLNKKIKHRIEPVNIGSNQPISIKNLVPLARTKSKELDSLKAWAESGNVLSASKYA